MSKPKTKILIFIVAYNAQTTLADVINLRNRFLLMVDCCRSGAASEVRATESRGDGVGPEKPTELQHEATANLIGGFLADRIAIHAERNPALYLYRH